MQGMNSIDGSYLEHFSLSRDPFEPSEAFFSGAGRQPLLAQLLHLSQFSSAVLVVSGASGSGRTTFARQYALEAKAWASSVSFIDVAEFHQPEELFVHLALAYGLRVEGGGNSGELLVELRQVVQQVPLVLVCDGAELLDDRVLSALMSLLQGTGQSPLKVLLTGDEKLVTRLDSFGMLDVLVQDWQLEELSKADITQYLSFLLAAAGSEQEDIFSAEELERLWQLSDGLPGRVMLPARELLVDKTMQAAELAAKPSKGVSVLYLGAAACCAAFLVVAFLYRGDFGGGVDGVNPAAVESIVTIPPAEVFLPEKVLAPAAFVNDTGMVLPSGLAGGQVSELSGEADAAEYSVPSVPPAAVLVDSLASSDTGIVNESVFPEVSESAVHQVTEAVLVVDLKPPLPVKLQESGRELENLGVSERHLMSLDAKHFVLQVLGAASRMSVEQFVEAQANSRDLYVFASERDGKPWYTVVMGDYPTRAEAKVAIKVLPEGQQLAGAWPRSLADVHSAIANNRGI